MVSKCANPECTTPFLYFHRGRLFRVETEGRQERRRNMGGEAGAGKPLRRIEFYWLCQDCAEKMTLTFDRATGISVRPRAANGLAQAAVTAA
ncbi:MAG TPA: hypothetical protein VL156_08085 [Terriglobales bacterium]|jgi:hypothetical protein|nr:hypothetical protein [Terriglobales bacterium]